MSGGRSRWAVLGPFVVAGLMAQGAYRLLVRPGLLSELSRIEGEVADLRPRSGGGAGDSDTGVAAAEEIRAELERTAERVAVLAGILPARAEAEPELHSLQALAARAGVRFRRFAPEPEYRLDGYRARAASVVAEGSFFELLGLFERISRLPQLVLIEDLDLRAAPEDLLECRFVAVSVRAAETGIGLASGADPTGGAAPRAAGPEGGEPRW